MSQIWKYEIGMSTTLVLPKFAKFLSVQKQNDSICAWFSVYPEAEKEPRKFRLIGTGHDYKTEDYKYLGTVQSGEFVWHLHEESP